MPQLSITYKPGTFPVNDNVLHSFSEITYKYGNQVINEGEAPEDVKTIYIICGDDGKINVSVVWEYWKSMFSMQVMNGEIEYGGWSIEDMITDIMKAAEEVAENCNHMTEAEIERMEEYPFVVFNRKGQYSVKSVKKERKKDILETLDNISEEEKEKLFNETKKIMESILTKLS